MERRFISPWVLWVVNHFCGKTFDWLHNLPKLIRFFDDLENLLISLIVRDVPAVRTTMGRNDIKYFNISEYCPGLGLTVSSCTDSQTWAWLCLAVQTVRPGQRLAVSGPARSCRQTRLRR